MPPISVTDLPPEPLRYASYARVSGALQRDKEISVPQQQRECQTYVLSRSGLLLREFADQAITGETLARPQLQALLAWAKEGAEACSGATLDKERDKETGKRKVLRNGYLDVVIVWKLDRLSRPDEDLDLDYLLIRRDLRLCGVRIESATEPFVGTVDPMQQFMSYVGRGQTGMEKTTREERFRLGRQGIAEGQGRQVGPPPYGYDWLDRGLETATRAEIRKGRPWAPVQPAASWVRFIYERCLAGDSVIDIVGKLNARGAVPPARTGDGARRYANRVVPDGWTHDSVHRILKNRRYAGYVYFEGQWHSAFGKSGGHAPLIPLDTWEQVQQVLAGRGTRREAGAVSLFAGGLLRCARCAAQGRDSSLVISTHDQRRYLADGTYSVHKYVVYKCYAALKAKRRVKVGLTPEEGCEGFQIAENAVLRLLTAYLKRLAAHLDAGSLAHLADRQAEVLRPRAQSAHHAQEAQRDEAARQLAQIPLMETNYQAQQAMGLMSLEKLAQTLTALREKEAALRAALSSLEADKPDEPLAALRAAYLLHLLNDQGAAPLQKRDALNAVFEWIRPGLDRKSLRVKLK